MTKGDDDTKNYQSIKTYYECALNFQGSLSSSFAAVVCFCKTSFLSSHRFKITMDPEKSWHWRLKWITLNETKENQFDCNIKYNVVAFILSLFIH